MERTRRLRAAILARKRAGSVEDSLPAKWRQFQLADQRRNMQEAADKQRLLRARPEPTQRDLIFR